MISVQLEPELVMRLRRIADATGVTMSELLRHGAQLVIAEKERG